MLDLEIETFAIRGAIFEVYKEIGPGFLESVYHECLEKEFYIRGIPYRAQVEININYKGMRLIHFFKADLICYDSIIIELKACKSLEQIHRAQLLNYLKATNMHVGMLVNFNAYPHVTIERMVLGPGKELPKDTGNMKEEYFTTEDTEEEGEK